MKQRVVALTGISGVGKTTFLRKLSATREFQHLTGGTLIAAARNKGSDARDSLRHADLKENQRLLVHGFALEKDPKANLIVMDGHVVIDNNSSLARISSTVFEAIDVSLMLHLEADPVRILKNRSDDTSRSRPTWDVETLAHHQEASREHARYIARSLQIDFCTLSHGDQSLAADLLALKNKNSSAGLK